MILNFRLAHVGRTLIYQHNPVAVVAKHGSTKKPRGGYSLAGTTGDRIHAYTLDVST